MDPIVMPTPGGLPAPHAIYNDVHGLVWPQLINFFLTVAGFIGFGLLVKKLVKG